MKQSLLGVTDPGEDGHTRVTRSKNCIMLGGDAEMHQKMQEFAVSVDKKAAGHSLDEMSANEVIEIVRESVRELE